MMTFKNDIQVQRLNVVAIIMQYSVLLICVNFFKRGEQSLCKVINVNFGCTSSTVSLMSLGPFPFVWWEPYPKTFPISMHFA
jgi:hypothetical protein